MQADREAVIRSMNREELKRALDAFGVTGADRRSVGRMQTALIHCSALAIEDLRRVLGPAAAVDRPALRADSPRTAPSRKRKNDEAPLGHLPGPFVAIDFETADTGRDSACAVALVRVEGDRIVDQCVRLIRPPRHVFQFTCIHGIRWADVAHEPTFGPVWNDMRSILRGASFMAAHNASFDKSVLRACCERAGLEQPELPFECTVRWARKAWDLYPTNLPAVCSHLGIALKHHDAASDAEACARIMIAARKEHLRVTRSCVERVPSS